MVVNFSLLAQSKKIVHLNQHLEPISAESETNQFTKTITISKEGNYTERYYNLENRPFMVILTEFDKRKKMLFQKTEKYDLEGQMIYQNVVDRNANKALTTYFRDQEQIMTLLCEEGICEGSLSLNGEEIKINRDVFLPVIAYSIKAWNNFLIHNLKCPPLALKSKMEGVVKLGLEILADGSLGRSEVVNPNESSLPLQQEALRVIQIYKGGFIPGIDAEGNPVSGWFYIPIRFKFGTDVNFKIS